VASPRGHLRVVAAPGEIPAHSPAAPSAPELPQPHDLSPAALYRAYASYVAAVGARLLGRDGEVDDLVQEVFLQALRGVTGLRDPLAVKAWLATVAVRVARRKLRARRLRAFLGFDEVDSREFAALVAPGADPEQRALLARVYAVLDELPVDARLAWTLRHVEGEELARVAALCSCSLATAKRRVAHAHAVLEARLRRG
jgi:RNA polymerase sigma-70 factor (ECF subfamily)